MTRLSLLASCLCALAACGGDGGGDDTGTEVQGVARYRDARTDAAGAPHAPAAPPAQDAAITVTVRGTGTLSGLDPTCLDQAAGQFHALYAGDAALDGSGGYVSSLAEASAVVQTPGGCEIPELAVGVVTDLVVRAELPVTTANCASYCDASARAEAEAACEAAPDRAACWASAEADARAACTTECTTQTTTIVAEATIGASALGDLELDADALRAAALGELAVDLTFDALE
jgi:hypothetical protein